MVNIHHQRKRIGKQRAGKEMNDKSTRKRKDDQLLHEGRDIKVLRNVYRRKEIWRKVEAENKEGN